MGVLRLLGLFVATGVKNLGCEPRRLEVCTLAGLGVTTIRSQLRLQDSIVLGDAKTPVFPTKDGPSTGNKVIKQRIPGPSTSVNC